MTITPEQVQDTRVKRRMDLSFRLDGGPMPHGNPNFLHIDMKDRGDQSNTEESGLQ